jgi:hypothetical protein
MLYESFIHPLTILSTLPSAGVGALLALKVGNMDLSVIGIIGIILLIGIVKKNGIMLVTLPSAPSANAISPGRCDPRGLPAALPADPDDDSGGHARGRAARARTRHRLGAAATAGLCDGRRACVQPGADVVHNAGRLPVPRPLPAMAQWQDRHAPCQ